MVTVNLTDNALSDLNDIGEYIALDSEKYAQITVQFLFNSVNILEIHPLAGKVVPEIKHDSIREIIRGSYRIVYQIINEKELTS